MTGITDIVTIRTKIVKRNPNRTIDPKDLPHYWTADSKKRLFKNLFNADLVDTHDEPWYISNRLLPDGTVVALIVDFSHASQAWGFSAYKGDKRLTELDFSLETGLEAIQKADAWLVLYAKEIQ